MKITVSFLHLEHTEALDQRIKEKSEKLNKYFKDKGVMKWSCYVKNGEHFAEVNYHAPNCEYHAKASSDNLYHSIDMVIDKIEKQVYKKKEKYSKIHRENPEVEIVDPAMAWTDYKDEDVA
jgi:putative sigma-54 modulation protein